MQRQDCPGHGTLQLAAVSASAQQIINAFPYDTAPKYLLRDRDSIYGSVFVQRLEGMGIQQKLISPRSPWQNPYVERLVGSIRRECLDRVIVFQERQLRQTCSTRCIMRSNTSTP